VSRALERRLERVEAAMGPKVLGYYHYIYASSMADYERQRADLIACGRAKPTDLILDANWQKPVYRGEGLCDPPVYLDVVKEPETHAWTMTHEERVRAMANEEGAR
jgi:hypothetical protein